MRCLKFAFLMEINIDSGENVMFVETGLRWSDTSQNSFKQITWFFLCF